MWNKVKPFFEFCGVLQFLWGLYGMIFGSSGEIYKDIQSNFNITYEFVYSGMLAIGTTTIIYLLIALVPKIYRWFKSFKVEPNMSIRDAIDYIIETSRFGTSIQKNQHGNDDVIKSIKSLLLKGDLKLFGTSRENPLVHRIKNDEFNDDNLEVIYQYERSYGLVHIAFISDGEDNAKIKNLMISKKQLTKEFPSRYEY